MSDYRDVTPDENSQNSFNLKSIFNYILIYLKNPLEGVRQLPNWSWSTLLVTTLIISMATGMLSGVLAGQFLRIVAGATITPIIGITLSLLGSLVIFYYFQVFEMRTVSLQKLYTLMLFANLPFFIFQIASELIAPISLVGFAFTALLLVVGLTENFSLEKRKSIRLVAIFYAVFAILWIINLMDVNAIG